jgi:ubiquinone/menaquinone biosynthesis C-methylase UbiE
MDYMREASRANHPSHDIVTDLICAQYPDIPFRLLDCGVLSGVTYHRFREARVPIKYTGIDIGEAILACRRAYPEAAWEQMSVTDLAFPDGSFEVVNCRHLLECLPYYETAVREAFRVASRHVAICLFQVPREPEVLLRRETTEGYIWLNRYAPGPLEALLKSLSESVEIIDASAGRRTDRIYFCAKQIS